MPKFKDLTNKKYNKLTAIRITNERDCSGNVIWLCKCDCGKETNVAGCHLTTGHTKSCGCLRKIAEKINLNKKRRVRVWELEGKRFGSLLVISKTKKRMKDGSVIWLCKCDCGKIIHKSAKVLKARIKNHCICPKYKDKIAAAKHDLLRRYKREAKNRNIKFELSFKEFVYLTSKNCFYCGIKPLQKGSYRHGEKYLHNGIDRMDNNLGYVKGNCVPACKKCNVAKRDGTFDEFKEWIDRIYKKLNT